MRKNCWEYKQCGRQEGGGHVHDLGVCPASIENKLNGVHGGTNAGRACWVVAGTLCREVCRIRMRTSMKAATHAIFTMR